ncbi:MAG: hypothetical protein M1572_04425 [Gammaproteobacteria bacterium]|nr:hypothetical protein [Gammaproteobacteria bacterium]
MQIQKECDDTALLQQLDAVLAEVGGALAPFDPYLHWSLNQRCCFFEEADAELVREYAGGVAIIRVEKMFYVARRFLRSQTLFAHRWLVLVGCRFAGRSSEQSHADEYDGRDYLIIRTKRMNLKLEQSSFTVFNGLDNAINGRE